MIKRKNKLQKIALIMKAKGKSGVVRQVLAMNQAKKAVESDNKKSGIMQNFLLAIFRFFL